MTADSRRDCLRGLDFSAGVDVLAFLRISTIHL